MNSYKTIASAWKSNIVRENVNSGFSSEAMHKVTVMFLELRVIKSFMQKF